MSIADGTRFGRYEIRAQIGEGGMGEVYLSQPLDGGPTKQLTKFRSDRMSQFDWSRDGKHLIIGRGPSVDDVVLIKDFR